MHLLRGHLLPQTQTGRLMSLPNKIFQKTSLLKVSAFDLITGKQFHFTLGSEIQKGKYNFSHSL